MTKRVLAIGTHPDDIEIGCGGTIALLAQQNFEINFLILTSGEEGCLANKEELKLKREKEAKKSANLLGVREVFFFREPDGLTFFTKESKIRLIKMIRTLKPEMIFIHSTFDNFPDHKVTSELSKAAILAAAGPWYPEAGTSPHNVKNVLGFEVWNPIQQPQMTINISDVFDIKLNALKCHETQIENVNYLGAIQSLSEFRGAMTMTGKYAESFEVIKIEGII